MSAQIFDHISIVPFVAICGADVPNQSTTKVPEHATCGTCRKFWYERFPQDAVEKAGNSHSMTVIASLNSGRRPNAKIIPNLAQSAIIPDHKQQLLRRIGNAQAEIGRLNKLLDEIRADVLHLTTE